MKTISRYIMTLALLLTAVTGAWADGTLLTTITASADFQSGSKTFDNIATVTLDGNFYGTSDWAGNGTIKVTPVAGVTITSVKFISNSSNIEDTAAPFQAVQAYDSNVSREIYDVDGVKGQYAVNKIEVYGTAEAPITVEWNASAKTGTFEMPGSDVVLTPIYAPTKVTMAVNDKTMGTAEVAGESKVEWTADTWKGWNYDTKEYTVGDITMTSSKKAYIRETTEEGDYKNSLSFGVIYSSDESTVTFSTTGDPFSRIEFTMLDDYSESNPNNPHILPLDNWTFEGKSAVWEGEATKSLTLQSCSTNVSKITFFKGAIPDGVTVNGDGTFTVAKTATVTLKATPAEGYKLKGWSDAPDCTDLVREITIEPGEEDMIITANFEEMTYTATFNAANANTIEAGKATVTVGGTAATVTEGKLEGVKMGSEVKLKANTGYKFRKVEVKKAAPALKTLTVKGMQLKYVEGDTWQQAIERPENEGSSWRVQNNYIFNGGYTLFINEGAYVYVRPGDTIDATKNYSLEAD